MTILLFLARLAPAATLALLPDADATLIEIVPTNSAGGADFFTAGTTQNRTRNRALLRFPIASALPSNAVITGAGLTLQVIRNPGEQSPASVFGLHRVLRNWNEGSTLPDYNLGGGGGWGGPSATNDATWTHRFAFTTNTWSSPGGAAGVDYVSAFSSSVIVELIGSYFLESTLDMTADVQRWHDHPEQNFGWMLISESEATPFTARKFGSRENPGAEPVLVVDYLLRPQLAALPTTTNTAALQFSAGPGQTYVIERSLRLPATNWTSVLTIPPPAQDTNITITDPLFSSSQFYRVRTY